MLLLVLLLLPSSSCLVPRDKLESSLMMVTSLRNHFFSGCVFLFYSKGEENEFIHGLQSTRTLLVIRKVLNDQGIPSSLLDIEDAQSSNNVQCRENFPFKVILSSNAAVNKSLVQLSRNSSFVNAFWLLFLQAGADVDEYLHGVLLPFDVTFLVAQFRGRRIRLTEVYRAKEEAALVRYPYGSWNGSSKTDWPSLELYSRRTNLHGRVIRAGATDKFSSPFYVVENRTQVGGFFGNMWQMIEKRSNFTTVFTQPADKVSGYRSANGSWTGLLGMIERREVEMILGMMVMAPERREVVHFPFPIMITKYCVFIQHPQNVDISWTNFLSPFCPSLWVMIGVYVATTALCLATFYRCGRTLGDEEILGPCLYTFKDALFYAFGAYNLQGNSCIPRSSSCRLVLQTAYFTAMVLSASYSANLVAFITVQEIRLPFKDLKGILEDGTYKFGVIRESSEFSYFSNSSDSILQQLFTQQMSPDPKNFPTSELEGLMRVCSYDKYAFMAAYTTVLDVLQHVNCSIIAVPIDMPTVAVSIAMSKTSSFYKFVNHNLQKLSNVGILKRLQKHAQTSTFTTQVEERSLYVSLNDVMPLLALLTTGHILALALLLLEHLEPILCHFHRRFMNRFL